MKAYAIQIDGRQVGVVLSKSNIGGNDLELISLAFCNEYNASSSRVSTAFLGDDFVALEIKERPEETIA